MKKILLTLTTFLTTFFLTAIVTYAAPVVMPDGTTFDAEYYAAENPDVVAALGNEPEALYQHYVQYGKAEGRLPVAPESNFGAVVSVETYEQDNPLLGRIVFGTITTYEDGTVMIEENKDYLVDNLKSCYDEQYLIPRVFYSTGLIDEDKNGIDDRDPYNNCGYTDFNNNCIADGAPSKSCWSEDMLNVGRLCKHGVAKPCWYTEDFCQPCAEAWARTSAKLRAMDITWE